MDLREVLARHMFGSFSSDDLPSIALAAILADHESVSLAALAGATRADSPADRWELFRRGLAELGLAAPTRLEAAEFLKRVLARRVARGELAPMAGAGQIVELAHEVARELPPGGHYVGETFGVARLVGIYYSWDDVAFDDDANHAQIELDLRDVVLAHRRRQVRYGVSRPCGLARARSVPSVHPMLPGWASAS